MWRDRGGDGPDAGTAALAPGLDMAKPFMEPCRIMPSSLPSFLSRPAVRYGLLAGAVVSVAVVVAVAAVAGGNGRGSDMSRRMGPGLAIAVVPPVEPTVDPGSTMEVGDLRTGFDKAALDRAAREQAEARADATLSPIDDWLGGVWEAYDGPSMPAPTAVADRRAPMQAYEDATARRANPDRPDGAWTNPRRDRIAQERAALWAARAAGRETDDVNVTPGPVAYNDVIRYSSE